MTDSRRGYVPEDKTEFSEENLILLRKAQQDILFLLEQGYPIKNASTFVGNHYMLSQRQRLAVVRATTERNTLEIRRKKQLSAQALGSKVSIDGLNIIITLEVALSEGTLISCMDTVIRDLAGLRGTYRLIDVTNQAILMIGDQLAKLHIKEAVFFLDAPVSNTGRLKQKILELLELYPFLLSVELVNNADVILEKLNNVITGDAIILNQCESWYNLVSEIIAERLPGAVKVNLSDPI